MPLTGVNKEVLFELHRLAEIGLMYNETKSNRYCLFINTLKSADVRNYLNKVAKIVSITETSSLKALYEIECKEEFKKDWSRIMKGKYSLVDKATVFETILPTLRENRNKWRAIFYRDKDAIRDVIKKRLETRYSGNKLKEVVEDTLKDLEITKTTFEIKSPLKIEENTI